MFVFLHFQMTSSIYGITVTVLTMYIILGTSVTFCRMRKNFAHVFGKRNDGFLQDNVGNVYEKPISDPLIDRIRSYVFSDLKGEQDNFDDSLLKDSLYDKDIDVATTPQTLSSYGNEQRDRDR